MAGNPEITIPTSTGDVADPYHILGVVVGCSVLAGSIVKDTIESIRNLMGGEMPHYARLLESSVEEALSKIQERGKLLDADMIICVRFATANIVEGGAEIIAYGTAIKFLRKDE